MTRALCFLLICILIPISPSFAEEILSLADCIALAKKGNLNLIQSEIAVDKARAEVTRAYSSYYPTVALSSGYRYDGDGAAGSSYSTGVEARLTLYKGGSVRASARIANAEARREEEDYRQTEADVTLAVKEAFYTILQRQNQIGLIDEILERREEELTLIKLKYDIGRESSPAVKEAEVSLLQARHDGRNAEEELSLSKSELNVLLGRQRSEGISIRNEEEEVAFPSLEAMTKQAKAERPEILAEKARREALEGQIAVARSGYLPALSVSSSYGLQGRELLEQEGGWSVGASVSMPIFNGFATSAEVKKAVLSLREQETVIRELEQGIEEEIERAWVNWELAEENLEVSQKTLEAASEMYELTRLQYEQGSTSYLFLQQKENALAQAEYGLINARYDLRVARARLEKAWGKKAI
jgi:outer membrane protein